MAEGLEFTFKIEDHTKEVLEAMKEQLEVGLAAVGEKMEDNAKGGCPVRTGRLRDSIVYVTKDSHGTPGPKAEGDDGKPKGKAEEYEVQIGTNVKYAPRQEFGDNISHKTGGAHFLRNAAANHADKYKSILETALS